MVQHRIRRLPVTDGDELVGIVTIDDLAVRAGDLHQAPADHRRGGQGGAAGVLLPPAGRLIEPADPGPAAHAAPRGERDQADGAGARPRAGGGRPGVAHRRARRPRVLPAARRARDGPHGRSSAAQVNKEDALQWEARWARPAAVSAFLAGLRAAGRDVPAPVDLRGPQAARGAAGLPRLGRRVARQADRLAVAAGGLGAVPDPGLLLPVQRDHPPDAAAAAVVRLAGPDRPDLLRGVARDRRDRSRRRGPPVRGQDGDRRRLSRVPRQGRRRLRQGPARGGRQPDLRRAQPRGLGGDRLPVRDAAAAGAPRGAAEPVHGHPRRDRRGADGAAADAAGPRDHAGLLAGRDRRALPRQLAGRTRAGLGDAASPTRGRAPRSGAGSAPEDDAEAAAAAPAEAGPSPSPPPNVRAHASVAERSASGRDRAVAVLRRARAGAGAARAERAAGARHRGRHPGPRQRCGARRARARRGAPAWPLAAARLGSRGRARPFRAPSASAADRGRYVLRAVAGPAVSRSVRVRHGRWCSRPSGTSTSATGRAA